GSLQEMVRGGPVAVAVEDRAADSSVQDSLEREVFGPGRPVADDRVGGTRVALDPQPLLVGGAAAHASIVRCGTVLEAAFVRQRQRYAAYFGSVSSAVRERNFQAASLIFAELDAYSWSWKRISTISAGNPSALSASTVARASAIGKNSSRSPMAI